MNHNYYNTFIEQQYVKDTFFITAKLNEVAYIFVPIHLKLIIPEIYETEQLFSLLQFHNYKHSESSYSIS